MEISRISIYVDKDWNLIITPYWREPQGVAIASKKYITIKSGWNTNELAEAIMEGLRISENNEQEGRENRYFWTQATGIKGFAAFSKKYRSISIDYLENKNMYTVTAEKRYKDGSYGIDTDDIPLREKTYQGRPSVETIGEQVLEALKIE